METPRLIIAQPDCVVASVPSASGKVSYTVTAALDADGTVVTSCTCAGHTYGDSCYHAKSVEMMRQHLAKEVA